MMCNNSAGIQSARRSARCPVSQFDLSFSLINILPKVMLKPQNSLLNFVDIRLASLMAQW